MQSWKRKNIPKTYQKHTKNILPNVNESKAPNLGAFLTYSQQKIYLLKVTEKQRAVRHFEYLRKNSPPNFFFPKNMDYDKISVRERIQDYTYNYSRKNSLTNS